MPRDEEPTPDEDTMRILIATDCHIGYMEKDGVRGRDSLTTFEEILQIAKKKDVDFILLGGDLFHDNKPSRNALHGTMSLLRKYCMGDKPCSIEMRSDQSVDFGHTPFPVVNYEDPNLNVGIPVFSIHGNHDDPTGQGNLCSLDLLSAAGLVNYFGKYTNLERIEISPLLMQKGATKLALYGLGSIRDERLHRMFCDKNVQMLRPKETQDEWFNLLVLHQNHAKRGPKNYIPEQFLDDFLDLVFWGHEHDCKIDPAWNGQQEFYVTQPGSSIATSLSEGETGTKYIGLLQIKNKNFKINKIPLETVRQFYMKDVVLADTSINPDDPECAKRVRDYCTEHVERLLETAEEERFANSRLPEKPLIRIRVDYSGGFDVFNTYRFGQLYVDKVANPRDLVLFTRRKITVPKDEKDDTREADDTLLADLRAEHLDSRGVEDMVKDYFSKLDKNKQMLLLTEKGIGDAVKEFVDKDERDAISELVNYQLKKTQKHLDERKVSEDLIDVEVARFKDNRKGGKEEAEEVEAALKIARTKSRSQRDGANFDDDFDGNDSDDGAAAAPTPTRGRGSRGGGRGRGSRGGGESTRARGRGRGGRGGRGRGAAVAETSIAEAFNRGSSKPASRAKKTRDDSDNEVTMIDDSSDEDFGASNKRKSKQNGTSQKSPRSGRGRSGRGVAFDDSDDDDDDEFRMPTKKRR